jgi:hypothetical protein
MKKTNSEDIDVRDHYGFSMPDLCGRAGSSTIGKMEVIRLFQLTWLKFN